MVNLGRIERAILIFLAALLLLGIAVSSLRKLRPPARITIEKFDPEAYKDAAYSSSSQEAVDINLAGADDLAKIKGIGKTLACRIVEYRYRNGSFASIDDLKNVKGIGPALFEKLRNGIKVE